jgi:transcriptional regulator with XRE-family HTH domain
MEFGKRIKDLRNEKEITQNQLADNLEVSRSTIAMTENGERQAGYDLLIKLADYFNVSIDYLLCRTDNKNVIIVTDNIDNNKIELEVDRTIYPNGLTHDEILVVLEKLKDLGIDWEKFKKK